jgi:uncharacterized protein (DUF1015 family)
MPALAARAKQKLYESPLMFGSGSIAGWALDDEHFITEVFGAFFEKQPATPEPFYFAVGDGNHSLAAAKEIWEEYKAAHPNDKSPLCRYAMVEIENLYDKGIDFEPIHRILWRNDASAEFVLGELRQYLEKGPLKALGGKVDSAEKLGEFAREPSQNNRIACFRAGEYYTFEFENKELAIAAVQPILDSFIADKPYEMDYIHGDETLCKLVQANQNRVGVLLPPFRKDGLFETIAKTGPLPRKSFSMGEAEEKRFYIEARRLVNFPY